VKRYITEDYQMYDTTCYYLATHDNTNQMMRNYLCDTSYRKGNMHVFGGDVIARINNACNDIRQYSVTMTNGKNDGRIEKFSIPEIRYGVRIGMTGRLINRNIFFSTARIFSTARKSVAVQPKPATIPMPMTRNMYTRLMDYVQGSKLA